MSERTLVRDVPERIGHIVTVKGFVQTVRDQKQIQFLVVRDHTGLLQCVNFKSEASEVAALISLLTPESSVIVTGEVVEAPQVKLGGIELKIHKIEIANLAEALPITPESSLEARMDHRHVSLRFERDQLVMRVQTTLEAAFRQFCKGHEFMEMHSPKLMGTASESGAELFELPYFGRKAYLAQSPQFYKQLAVCGGFPGVFEIGPVFRANPSHTSRHDTEFTSMDVEIAWVESHEDVMKFEEELLVFMLQAVAEEHGKELKRQLDVEVVVPTLPFPRITLDEAREVLSQRGHEIVEKADLDPEGERMLSQYILETFGHQFVFVTGYPASARAFYHMYEPGTHVTKSYDLLWKGLEITTGAQREHRVEQLMKQATEKGFGLEPLAGYFGFFRHGAPPHGGFGMGLTRLLMCITELGNVREVTFLYRGINRLTP